MNLGNYIDELKAVFVARNGLSDIGYKDWYSWGNGELKDTYLKKYAAQLKGLNLEQANLALSTQLLSNSQKEAILVEAGLVASKDKIKASLVESALAQNIDSEATQKAILEKLKLTQANGVLIASDKECTEADLRRVLTEANIIGVEQERIVTATGVATAQTGEITSTNLLSLAVEKLGMKLGITNAQMAGFKLGVGIFAAVAAAGTAVFALYKNYQRQMDEAVKAASEAGSEIDENTKSINEQIEKVKELREQLADNSTTQEEAKNIKQELLGIQDSLVEKYGEEAESINLVNGNLEKQIDLLNDLSKSQLKDYFKDEENRKGAKESTKRMTEKKTYNLGNISSGSEGYDIVTDIVKDFKNKGLELVGGSGGMAGAAFTIKINGDAKSVESTIKQIELNGQIIGLELTLYTDSSFAFMDEVSVEYNCSAGTSFQFWDNSDEITDFNNQLLPNLEITILSKGNFKLENSRDNKVMKIDNCVSNEIISINGKNQLISSSESSHDLANDFNYFFPRIINSYNDRCNIFTPNLDCKIKITYSPIRKVGI